MAYLIAVMLYFALNFVIAMIMQNVAVKKGQEDSHSFIIVFLFGIIGCLYVIALPDEVLRKQNEDILTILLAIKGENNDGDN